MRLEELVVEFDVGQLRPLFRLHGDGIQIVDLRTLHGQQKGGVGGDDELAAVEARAVLQKAGKLHLPFGRETVFRLVQEVQGVAADLLREVAVGVLAVGLPREIPGDTAGGKIGSGGFPCVAAVLQLLHILQRTDLKAALPQIIPLKCGNPAIECSEGP